MESQIPNDFDIWNEKKKAINNKSLGEDFSFHEREIWWCSLGKNVGSEENGKYESFERPVIVFRIFNKDTLWIIPLTTNLNIKDYRKEYSFLDRGVIQVADLTQLRLISTKRLLRYKGFVGYKDFQIIRKYLKELI